MSIYVYNQTCLNKFSPIISIVFIKIVTTHKINICHKDFSYKIIKLNFNYWFS